jgi:translation initiation factor 2B subunit (eIF-2B alpha/beta/delta family)
MTDKAKLPRAISQILDDRESGSVSLLNRLLVAIEQELHQPEIQTDYFQTLLNTIRGELRHFAAIENCLSDLITACGKEHAFPRKALKYITAYRFYWNNSQDLITENFLQQCQPEGKTILTHSHSQTFISLLDQLKQRKIPFKVIQTLSVPGEEGKRSLERMHQMKLEAQLIDDTDIIEALEHSDLVVIGCDALMDTEFLNKVGTGNILRKAKIMNIPSFLLTESRKRIDSPTWKNELTGQSLFEWVPLRLVKGIINEIS